MARYTGPKHRLARREGYNVLGKVSASLERRLNQTPGQHGPKGSRRKVSEYGQQLREKQKVRRIYGVLERQFVNYMKEAQKQKGETGTVLLSLLEKRLDNVLYRLKIAKTRNLARQLVSHGHVQINSKRVNIPSYQVRIGEVITLSTKATNMPDVKKALDEKEFTVPSWLERKGPAGTIKSGPRREDVDAAINEQLIVEYYSR